MTSSSLAPCADSDTDSVTEDQTHAPAQSPASLQYVPWRLQYRSTYLPSDHSSVQSPHTTVAPIFTGVALELTSAPKYPVQDQARAPHTAAAPIWTYILAASSALHNDPQKAEFEETNLEAVIAPGTLDRSMMVQGQRPISTLGQEKQQLYATPESQAHSFYSSANEQQSQHLNQEHSSAGSLSNGGDRPHQHRGSPQETLQAPVNTIHGLLPPRSKRRKAALMGCCLSIMTLAILLGVVFGKGQRDNLTGKDHELSADEAPPFPVGETRNTTSNPTLESNPTRTLNPTFTLATYHGSSHALEAFVSIEPTGPQATTAKATSTIQKTVEAPPPTSRTCAVQCSDKDDSCSYGCYYSDTLCQEKCGGGPLTPESNACGVACRYAWSSRNQECSKAEDACVAKC